MKSVTLPSGSKLDISVSEFKVSKALYQAICEEAKGVQINSAAEVANLSKDLVCTLLSSKKVESALDECMKRVVYNNRKVDQDTWEPVEAREDYFQACYEVAKENIEPFLKPLMQKYSPIVEKLKSSLA